ncbi:MAG: hypothetical protein GY816_02555 [Cytophagales bacterium]|nr:hypothetical protein [Cytophagales bacterium]
MIPEFMGKMNQSVATVQQIFESISNYVASQLKGISQQKSISIKAVAKEGIEESSNPDIVTFTCEEDFQAKIIPGVFSHVISNLIKNAITYSGEERVEVKIDVQKRIITVRDHRVGIPPGGLE